MFSFSFRVRFPFRRPVCPFTEPRIPPRQLPLRMPVWILSVVAPSRSFGRSDRDLRTGIHRDSPVVCRPRGFDGVDLRRRGCGLECGKPVHGSSEEHRRGWVSGNRSGSALRGVAAEWLGPTVSPSSPWLTVKVTARLVLNILVRLIRSQTVVSARRELT